MRVDVLPRQSVRVQATIGHGAASHGPKSLIGEGSYMSV